MVVLREISMLKWECQEKTATRWYGRLGGDPRYFNLYIILIPAGLMHGNSDSSDIPCHGIDPLGLWDRPQYLLPRHAKSHGIMTVPIVEYLSSGKR